MPVSLITQVIPIVHLLTKIIECLSDLQKNSKKHSAGFAELKAQMIQLKSTIEAEVEARKKEQELAAAERSFVRKLIYGTAILGGSSWVYIGLHIAGWIR